jgi:hypothetical protein
MYPPHVAAMGENQPLQETNKLQNPWLIPVKEVQGYEVPPVKEIVNVTALVLTISVMTVLYMQMYQSMTTMVQLLLM